MIVRYNPDCYAENGKVVKPTAEQRLDAIQRVLNYVPQNRVTILYLFYRSTGGWLPDVVGKPAYDERLRQYVLPAEIALYSDNL